MINKIKSLLNNQGFIKYSKNTMWILSSKIICMIVSYIATIYTVRYLGPTNNGLIAFSIGFVGIFSVLANFGLDLIFLEKISRNPENKNEILGSALLLRFITSLITVILIIFATYALDNDRITSLLIIIYSISLLFSPPTLIGYYFQSKAEGKYQAIVSTSISITLSLLKIFFALYGLNIFAFILIFTSENILSSILWILFYRRAGNSIRKIKYNKQVFNSLIVNSTPLLLSSAATVIYTRADQILLKYLSNIESVGIYDAAVRISELWYFIPTILTYSLFPAIINAQKTSKELFNKRLAYLYSFSIYTSLAIGLMMTLFANKIITLIYGPQFIEGVTVLQIYGWATLPMSLSIIMNTYLLLINKNRITLLSSLISMITNVILNLILIPIYGLSGAAIATIISYSMLPTIPLFFKDAKNQAIVIKDSILLPFKAFK